MIRRFICAGDLRKRIRRGDIAAQKTGLRCWRATSDTQVFKRAIDMTDDELAAIVGRAKLTVV